MGACPPDLLTMLGTQKQGIINSSWIVPSPLTKPVSSFCLRMAKVHLSISLCVSGVRSQSSNSPWMGEDFRLIMCRYTFLLHALWPFIFTLKKNHPLTSSDWLNIPLELVNYCTFPCSEDEKEELEHHNQCQAIVWVKIEKMYSGIIHLGWKHEAFVSGGR